MHGRQQNSFLDIAALGYALLNSLLAGSCRKPMSILKFKAGEVVRGKAISLTAISHKPNSNDCLL